MFFCLCWRVIFVCCTGCHSHCGWLSALHFSDLQMCFRSSPWRRVLVHGRHRLDHRPFLHLLRPSCKRGHKCPCEWLKQHVMRRDIKALLLLTNVCICNPSLKVSLSTLMLAGCGRSLRSTKSPSFTQLLQPSACWWSTDMSRCRSESMHLLEVIPAQPSHLK